MHKMQNINSIAIIYDNVSHPMTTGEYCRRALEKICKVTHFHPSDIDKIPERSFDLYLNIDDSLRYILPLYLRPAAWWVIDTHLQYDWDLQKARLFDVVFSAQKDGADRLRMDGIKNVHWLPLGCDPEIHKRFDVEMNYDWCFVGTTEPDIRYRERIELLRLLKAGFPNGLITNAYKEEMAKVFSSSRIIFNRSIKNDINMRVFEALSTGSLLITNNLDDNGMPDLFEDGNDYVSYHNAEDLIGKVSYYLENPEQMKLIAGNGMERVRKYHTYQDRMKVLLEKTEEVLSKIYTGEKGGYYHISRPELFELVSPDVKKVLEIGCASGLLGESIKNKYGVYVAGIELVPDIAEEARQRLDFVVNGDCEELDFLPIFGTVRFDCVILGDVIEHLREPEKFLLKLRPFITDDANIIASIPNVQNISVIADLAKGNWTYMDYGILDRTHLRFFTRKEIRKMFVSAGFEITTIKENFDCSYHRWVNQGKPGQFKSGSLTLGPLPEEEIKDFFVIQYLIKATAKRPLISIVILTFNGLNFIKLCIESVIKFTELQYELVIVDNGSEKDVTEYLGKLKEELGNKIKLIINSSNMGFPYGCNQGIKASDGDYIVLLNSDTVVTEGWLSGLYSVFEKYPEVGIAGPLTNNTIPGEQMVSHDYKNIGGLELFAGKTREKNKGQVTIIQYPEYLTGFCMMIKREVTDNIGMFDTDFGLGTFEDADLCWRAGINGYKLAVVRDVFIHHQLRGSFGTNNIDIERISQKNQDYFMQKGRLNGYREVEINMDNSSTKYINGEMKINYIVVDSVKEGDKKNYLLNINFSISDRLKENIHLDITKERTANLSETANDLLIVKLEKSGYGGNPEFLELCKKALQDVLDLKIVKLPVPERVIFLMNNDRRPEEILCSPSA